jgi:hypothetical protein
MDGIVGVGESEKGGEKKAERDDWGTKADGWAAPRPSSQYLLYALFVEFLEVCLEKADRICWLVNA